LWRLGAWRTPLAVVIVAFSVVLVCLPILQLVLASLTPYFGAQGVFTLDNFVTILGDPETVGVFVYTASVAAAAAAIAVVIVIVFGWGARMRRGAWGAVIDSTQISPMIVPGLLLGIGLITVVLLGPLAGAYGTYGLLMIGLFVSIVPLASRSISGALAQIPDELEEAARVSGSSRGRALVGVVFRLLLPSALNGWLLCFVVVSGSLAIPLLLSPRGQTLLAVKVYDLYMSADIVTAAAVFVVFILEILVITIVIEALKRLVGRRRVVRPFTSSDPDWTGAVAVDRPRRFSRTPAVMRSHPPKVANADAADFPHDHTNEGVIS
jgi:iron(III) transport system permease protein